MFLKYSFSMLFYRKVITKKNGQHFKTIRSFTQNHLKNINNKIEESMDLWSLKKKLME
jgi:hypothetical protein